MKRLSAACLGCLLLWMVAISGAAAPARAGQTVVGSGRVDCVEYLDAEEAVKLSIENWVLGFFSFANLRSFNVDLLQNLDNGTHIDAVEGYCRDHPSARIAEVSAVLLKTLVASADGDCLDRSATATGGLSLCQIPGAAMSERTDIDLIIPAVE